MMITRIELTAEAALIRSLGFNCYDSFSKAIAISSGERGNNYVRIGYETV